MDVTEILIIMGLCVLAYILGSIPFGKIIGYFRKVDVQKVGSHNIGATNLLRASGKLDAALTLGLDAAKAGFPVYLAMRVFDYPWLVVSLVAAIALLGSCYSLWLKLKTGSWIAGKGVSALIGILAAIIGWPLILVVLLLWFFFVFIWLTNQRSSEASLLLVNSMPVLYLVFPTPVLIFFYPFAITLIGWRHKENIARMLKGKEKPINIGLPKEFSSVSLESLLMKYFPPKDKKKKP